MKTFREYREANSPMSIAAMLDTSQDYERGFMDAMEGNSFYYKQSGGGTQLQANRVGKYIWCWLDAGGDANILTPLQWLRCADLTMTTPNGVIKCYHKTPDWSDEEIAKKSEYWD